MDRGKIIGLYCREDACGYWTGEKCTLEINQFEEQENEEYANAQCAGHRGSYMWQQVRKRLEEESKEAGEQQSTEEIGQPEEQQPSEEIGQLPQMQQYATYAEYKKTLDGELTKAAESFVRIGYLLKVARDTNILAESGYASVVDFAAAEYNIDKTQVSRFIRINDKFSEGGYSDRLTDQFKGYGYAKLTLMLQLPDAVNETLTPDYSKSEIQAIKDEVDAENQVSDLERMMEDPAAAVEMTTIEAVIHQLGEDDPELYVTIHRLLHDSSWTIEDIKETLAPMGTKTYSVRLRGKGSILLMLDTDSNEVAMVSTRTGEKETCGWGDLGRVWKSTTNDGTERLEPEESWEAFYGREFPKVAPVQPEQNGQKAEQNAAKTQRDTAKTQQSTPKPKEPRVQKAPTEWASAYRIGQKVKIIATEEIGELLQKTDIAGMWKVRFLKPPTFTADQMESQFEEYDEIEEKVEQETLHDVEPSIPAPDPIEETEEPQKSPVEETEEPQLPGQQSIENYPEYMPEEQTEVIPPEEPTATSREGAAVDPRLENLLTRIEAMKGYILAGEWHAARIEVEIIRDRICDEDDRADDEEDEECEA